MLGIWKNYDDLEESLSVPELFTTLESMHDRRHEEHKFSASLKGVNLDENEGQEKWERIKARAFSGGRTDNPNDILALSGKRAQKEGFGIGMGIDYADSDDAQWWE